MDIKYMNVSDGCYGITIEAIIIMHSGPPSVCLSVRPSIHLSSTELYPFILHAEHPSLPPLLHCERIFTAPVLHVQRDTSVR